MRVLISGAGIGGPTLAYWLAHYGLQPTLIETAPRLRTGGYIIDFWGAGFDIADRYGPLPWKDGWTLSGATRFATGFPVTLFDNSDNSLLGTLGNGVNNYLLDTPRYMPGPREINTNGRNGRPAFNVALFAEETLGQLGNAKRRMFYEPGIANFDLALQKSLRLRGERSLDLRFEAFNALNHSQFYGPAAVDGQIEDSNFGRIVSAAAPRLTQIAAKFRF